MSTQETLQTASLAPEVPIEPAQEVSAEPVQTAATEQKVVESPKDRRKKRVKKVYAWSEDKISYWDGVEETFNSLGYVFVEAAKNMFGDQEYHNFKVKLRNLLSGDERKSSK